ncbi:MAG TPA: lactonase family protein [Edaphobacter sp.]|nr:lactonase family protein [Edaphobacter sp.]
MSHPIDENEKSSSGAVSRRGFLRGAAAAAVVAQAAPLATAQDLSADSFWNGGGSGRRRFAYLGTYTVGNGGNGEGIYLFESQPGTGELKFIKVASTTPSPSSLVASHSGNFLYAVNELSNFQGNSGSVSSFAVNRQTGDLTPINTVSSQGAGATFISIDASGKFLFIANYGGGSLAVIPINADGSVGDAVDVHVDVGDVGPTKATNAPPGSFAISGHDAPHVHCAIPDPNNKFVLQTDLGQDRIYVYSLNPASGKLTPAAVPYVSLPPGDGPRHLAFHPNGRWLYSIQEESSTLTFFSYDASSGGLISQQTISALPPGFAGTSFASELQFSSDGRLLYAANRLHDSIAVFSVNFKGELKYVGEAATRGDYPRQFTLDPTGNYLYTCNQRSDHLASFRIDRQTGIPKFIGQYLPAGSPSCLIFLP